MERKDRKRDCDIGLLVNLSDADYSDAIVRVIMAGHSGIRVLSGNGADESAENVFSLNDSAGGSVLFGPSGTGKPTALAFFRKGERISSITERIREISGIEPPSAGVPRSGTEAECIAFIASCGGSGVTTLAKNTGRLAFRDLGVRCLYLSLAPYGAGQANGRRNLTTRLFYRLMSDGIPDLRQLCSEERGVFVTESFGINPESGSLSPELLGKLRISARASGFGCVLLDIGNHLERDRVQILEMCGKAVSVRREGGMPVRASASGKAVYVENFCKPDSSAKPGVKGGAARPETGAVRIADMGEMNGIDPPAPYCEKVRRVIRLLEIGSGEGKAGPRG